MVLWVTLASMTAAAVVLVLWPLSRRPELAADERPDIRFYRDQIAEIARDEARGALAAPEAEAARTEAGRRLLRAEAGSAADMPDGTSEPALRRRRAASAVALSVVPLVGLAVYGVLGSPDIPSQTEADRVAARAATENLASALSRIEQHLASQPDDIRGWEVVAPVYLRAGRAADAAKAYAAARRLGGDSVDRLLGEGEALVVAANGEVGDAARDVFRSALALDPSSPRGRFYLALRAEQDGQPAVAATSYRSLLAGASSDAPWVPIVRARLARLETPAPVEPASPEILAMVDGLDGRLRSGGGTEAEWSRLVRSYVVLGRRDEALDRLGRARAALGAEPGSEARLDRLAADLGLLGDLARR